jgi:uncharacterized protein YegP (UPF0339 family)
MATATKKVHVAGSRARNAAPASEAASLAFVISQDNRGDYLWEIVDAGGKALVRAGGFACRDDAERAARYVHKSARLAQFGPRDLDQRKAAAV